MKKMMIPLLIFLVIGFVGAGCDLFGGGRKDVLSLDSTPQESSSGGSGPTGEPKAGQDQTGYPDTVMFDYKPLALEALTPGKASAEWVKLGELAFGKVEEQPVTLTIYREQEKQDTTITRQTSRYSAVLSWREKTYLISDVYGDAFLSTSNGNPPVGITRFNEYIPNGAKGLYFPGSIEMVSVNPGLKKMIVYDSQADQWLGFETWGNATFIDMDHDGTDEIILENPGLFVDRSDLSIIKGQGGTLQTLFSVVDALAGTQKDGAKWFAMLQKEVAMPLFAVGRIGQDKSTAYYRLAENMLVKMPVSAGE
ncbi:hypothetical protein [Gorillibacterium massiliense]|uniref:hypothetical protein n=1 Tax=Gorillibacterium massiliense TaxID=1280390 RepID=UPI0004B32C7C|nr:hypothetical protein [Gorillibacterium massiliense]